MDFGDSAEEATFRSSARVWLEANAPLRGSQGDFSTGRSTPEHFVAASKEWQGRLYHAGWAGIAWPSQYGGRGQSLALDLVFQEEQARFGVTTALFNVAIGMAGPTLIELGDDRQRARYLPPMLRGEEVWCQLFSEPSAGSDLAGITTRATKSGGGWQIDGHKVWTSQARDADFGILLARTDMDAPKHRGITYFLLDMRAPGIEVRPIRQMNGAAEFNEVFLTDVFVPDHDVVGDVNGGWSVAMTTLASERNLVGTEWLGYAELVSTARAHGLSADPVVRQRLAGAWVGAQLLRLLGFRVRTALTRGEPLGALPSLVNLLFARHLRSTGDLGLALLGPAAQLATDGTAPCTGWQHHVLTAPCVRIASGTDEIQLNIVGERALGLPREPRANV
ncbi:MAG TPA: acyl-CoA dehydrogenase family protein [Acidimicrobiales bacterium]|nr:acyl-CoA dehydrogenase family protein [Acidimicrobiales bacterium]